ncbi:stage II sporulation protein P [Clostridium felsineum]|uniref:stage II sporulation protein P n=1 Tax=Clostridium felsineum TaxID=36839 RepID=UPI00098C33D6|nr:stage II sporulation protein P [Clostridium felsineum]MCR3758594.1 stage II sporulation protein P [Clostridium felsineum]URZ04668.1 hypothetical protein CLAUR_047570 [Clostridium felsineum]
MKKIYKRILTGGTTLALITGIMYLGIGANKINSNLNSTIVSKSIYGNRKALKRSLPNIVIYSSESGEDYPSGKRVTDIGKLLNIKLKKKGLKSTFINNPIITKKVMLSYSDYSKTYENTRNLIKQNIKNYNKCILLDIYRDKGVSKNNTEISLVTNTPNYTKNRKFAEALITQLDKLKRPTNICPFVLDETKFNQDLSDKSMMLGIGNIKSSDSELNKLVDLISTAFKNLNYK